jgi:hypothetical protein
MLTVFTKQHAERAKQAAKQPKRCECKRETPGMFAAIEAKIGLCLLCRAPLPEVR